jgi:hypothetical protein
MTNLQQQQEIRIKWIRHTPLLKLDECVDNAMMEWAEIMSTGFCNWKELKFQKVRDNCFIHIPESLSTGKKK